MDRHDGRELELMLKLEKPLAAFSHYDGADIGKVLSGQDFEGHVSKGKFCDLRTTLRNSNNQNVNFHLFALSDEDWRLDAYMELMHFKHLRSWCSHLEWIQGKLLGYSDDENRKYFQEKYGIDGPEDDVCCEP